MDSSSWTTFVHGIQALLPLHALDPRFSSMILDVLVESTTDSVVLQSIISAGSLHIVSPYPVPALSSPTDLCPQAPMPLPDSPVTLPARLLQDLSTRQFSDYPLAFAAQRLLQSPHSIFLHRFPLLSVLCSSDKLYRLWARPIITTVLSKMLRVLSGEKWTRPDCWPQQPFAYHTGGDPSADDVLSPGDIFERSLTLVAFPFYSDALIVCSLLPPLFLVVRAHPVMFHVCSVPHGDSEPSTHTIRTLRDPSNDFPYFVSTARAEPPQPFYLWRTCPLVIVGCEFAL